jgi:outer membrane protein assembly factor BamA
MLQVLRVCGFGVFLISPLLAQPVGVRFVAVRLLQVKNMPATERGSIESYLLRRLRSSSLESNFDEDAYLTAMRECEERARDAFQIRGYFKVEIKRTLAEIAQPDGRRDVTVNLAVREGKFYRLNEIIFSHSTILEPVALRSMFPLQPGRTFSTARIRTGLENLRRTYGRHGYINFTPIVDTVADDSTGTILLRIDLDEGKRYRLGKVFVFGFSDAVTAAIESQLRSEPYFSNDLLERVLNRSIRNHRDLARHTIINRNDADGTVDIHIEHPSYERARFTRIRQVL